jgi:chemotaxis family two-component system response regulator Rcp1
MKDQIEILLVEDSPSDVRLTEEALKESGLKYKLAVVSDGQEAIDYLGANASSRPDVILLDLNMPRKNGHEVLGEIRKNLKLAPIPVVLLTVSQREQDVLEALRLKMNYYLAKPVEADKLAVLLKAIFELHADDAGAVKDGSMPQEDMHVRLVLASNPHTVAAVLRKLANETHTRIRSKVAENPNTPIDILESLAKDTDTEVRISVAENPNTPKTVLELLSKDNNDDVRLGLAENPKVPSDILKTLAADENVFIASSAAKTLSNSGASLI